MDFMHGSNRPLAGDYSESRMCDMLHIPPSAGIGHKFSILNSLFSIASMTPPIPPPWLSPLPARLRSGQPPEERVKLLRRVLPPLLRPLLASNEESYFPGSLPGNGSGSVLWSLPDCGPRSRPSSFPNHSAENLLTNLPSSLGSNEESPCARRG